jgi:hypothetical protein
MLIENVTKVQNLRADFRVQGEQYYELVGNYGDTNELDVYNWVSETQSSSASWDWDQTIQPGQTYELRVIVDNGVDNSEQRWRIDGVSVGDARQQVDLPDTLTSGTEHLDGPQDYPQQVEQAFAEVAGTRRELDFAKAVVDINNTDNGQFIELSNDGGSNYIRTTNSDTATASFSSASNEVVSRIGLSRHGSRTDETPLTGYLPQQINSWDLFANPLAVIPDGIGTVLTIGLIPRNEIVGSTIAELGQLDSNNNTLTRSIRAELTVESEMRVFSRERLQISQA